MDLVIAPAPASGNFAYVSFCKVEGSTLWEFNRWVSIGTNQY